MKIIGIFIVIFCLGVVFGNITNETKWEKRIGQTVIKFPIENGWTRYVSPFRFIEDGGCKEEK